jgi:hypothetical protein
MGFLIQPTNGRIVNYHPSEDDRRRMTIHGDGPLAAMIVHVWSDTCVNLVVYDSQGVGRGRSSVTLHQDEGPCSASPYCEWMPYQKGQAAKTEQLEQKLAAASEPVQQPATSAEPQPAAQPTAGA